MSDIADFYEPMRVLLGDRDPQQEEFDNATLLTMLRCAWLMGKWPKGYDLSSTTITPDVPVGSVFCQILMESLLAGVVGEQGAYSFKTRAISETDHGERKRDILQYAKQTLYDLRDGCAVFSSRQSLVAFLNTITDTGDIAGVSVLPGVNYGIDTIGGGMVVIPPV